MIVFPHQAQVRNSVIGAVAVDVVDIEPPFRLLANGLAADRRQWLRLLGNGVVPLQAAYAFCALSIGLGLMEAGA